MLKLNVNNIFYSIQGEGLRTGTANIFIRLAGCNLSCEFCDTNFIRGREYCLDELQRLIKQHYPCKNIIWTGGEPTLQLNEEIIDYFKLLGYYQAIETNGSNSVPGNIDFVTVSPKKQINITIRRADEIKIIYPHCFKPEILDSINIECKAILLSPCFDGDKINVSYLKECLRLIKQNPNYRLSMQVHKLIGIE